MRADREPRLPEAGPCPLRLRERRDAIAGQPENGPLIHWFSAKLPIKLNGGIIPIEHGPLHPPAAAISRDFGEIDQQGAAVTFAAMFRMDEQILQVESGAPE